MKEIWKPVFWKGVDYTGLYEVSNSGKIKSLQRTIEKSNGAKCKLKEKLLGSVDPLGYVCVTLSKNKKTKNVYIHSIVSETFDRPLKYNEVVDHTRSKLHNGVNDIRILTKRKNSSIEKTIKSGLPVGVYFCKTAMVRPYLSNIYIKKNPIHLGSYQKARQAARAYSIALQLIIVNPLIKHINIKVEINKYRKTLNLKPLRIAY